MSKATLGVGCQKRDLSSDIPTANLIRLLPVLKRPAKGKKEARYWEEVGAMFAKLAIISDDGSHAREVIAENVRRAYHNAGYNGRSERLAEDARRAKRD